MQKNLQQEIEHALFEARLMRFGEGSEAIIQTAAKLARTTPDNVRVVFADQQIQQSS